ncbi:unnamed protein product [Nyctereutes procyonoides]|uniref:(raccoon dog) hypothetical protein n=1 Tax=Nyctereutes procyonoides TaxID=34880 RepID=A0A811Z5W5_NYCPR|nr:unnamed protein product [Nyctereutes procyonoides]
MVQSVNITELKLPQLEMLKNQLDQEMELLSTSIAQLKVVQTKSVGAGLSERAEQEQQGERDTRPTDDFYVCPGKLHDVEQVLINVGTGYYVEKTAEDAKDLLNHVVEINSADILLPPTATGHLASALTSPPPLSWSK